MMELPGFCGDDLWCGVDRSRVVGARRRALERLVQPSAEPDLVDDAIPRLAAEQRIRHVIALVATMPQTDRDVFALTAELDD